MTAPLACRLCGAPLTRTLVDLGETPIANALLKPEQLDRPEPRYPLHARVCDACGLVQVEDVVPPAELFGDYVYFSSFSASWVEHARRYAEAAAKRFGLGPSSLVVEIASNDGYLLKHFVAMGIPVLGIEPAENVAEAARAAGVPTEARFFGTATARDLVARGRQADLIAANNVLAHVPDLNDFVQGFAILLKPSGTLTIEFPHLLNLIEQVQFDTIYHEHYSYFSLLTAERALARHGLGVFDAEELPTHGGSLRIYAAHEGTLPEATARLKALRAREAAAGIATPALYEGMAPKVERICTDLVEFLESAKADGKRVAAYGAAAKGNTLLNRAGIGTDLIAFIADRNVHKQGRFAPGSRLPIAGPERIDAEQPDYVLILPWNLRQEIAAELARIRGWGGQFVVPVPALEVF